MSDHAFRILYVIAGIVVVSAMFLSHRTTPSVVCSDYATLATPTVPRINCDEGATASVHDTPHGIVLICTCTAKEKP